MALWGAGGSNSILGSGGGGGGYVRGSVKGSGQSVFILVGEGGAGVTPFAMEADRPSFGDGGSNSPFCGNPGVSFFPPVPRKKQ